MAHDLTRMCLDMMQQCSEDGGTGNLFIHRPELTPKQLRQSSGSGSSCGGASNRSCYLEAVSEHSKEVIVTGAISCSGSAHHRVLQPSSAGEGAGHSQQLGPHQHAPPAGSLQCPRCLRTTCTSSWTHSHRYEIGFIGHTVSEWHETGTQ